MLDADPVSQRLRGFEQRGRTIGVARAVGDRGEPVQAEDQAVQVAEPVRDPRSGRERVARVGQAPEPEVGVPLDRDRHASPWRLPTSLWIARLSTARGSASPGEPERR